MKRSDLPTRVVLPQQVYVAGNTATLLWSQPKDTSDISFCPKLRKISRSAHPIVLRLDEGPHRGKFFPSANAAILAHGGVNGLSTICADKAEGCVWSLRDLLKVAQNNATYDPLTNIAPMRVSKAGKKRRREDAFKALSDDEETVRSLSDDEEFEHQFFAPENNERSNFLGFASTFSCPSKFREDSPVPEQDHGTLVLNTAWLSWIVALEGPRTQFSNASARNRNREMCVQLTPRTACTPAFAKQLGFRPKEVIVLLPAKEAIPLYPRFLYDSTVVAVESFNEWLQTIRRPGRFRSLWLSYNFGSARAFDANLAAIFTRGLLQRPGVLGITMEGIPEESVIACATELASHVKNAMSIGDYSIARMGRYFISERTTVFLITAFR